MMDVNVYKNMLRDIIVMELNGENEEFKVIKKSGRPRKYPIDPVTGKSTYVDPRIHNKIDCPVCFQKVMECNLHSHIKTVKCKRVGELLALRTKVDES
jgi:hypothetical protein